MEGTCVHTSGGFDQKRIELVTILNDLLSDLTLNSEVFGLATAMNSATEMHLFVGLGHSCLNISIFQCYVRLNPLYKMAESSTLLVQPQILPRSAK